MPAQAAGAAVRYQSALQSSASSSASADSGTEAVALPTPQGDKNKAKIFNSGDKVFNSGEKDLTIPADDMHMSGVDVDGDGQMQIPDEPRERT